MSFNEPDGPATTNNSMSPHAAEGETLADLIAGIEESDDLGEILQKLLSDNEEFWEGIINYYRPIRPDDIKYGHRLIETSIDHAIENEAASVAEK